MTETGVHEGMASVKIAAYHLNSWHGMNDELRSMRLALGLTQRQLATMLHLPKAAISMAELFKRPFPKACLDYLRVMYDQRNPDIQTHPVLENAVQQHKQRETLLLREWCTSRIDSLKRRIQNVEKQLARVQLIPSTLERRIQFLMDELSHADVGTRHYDRIAGLLEHTLRVHPTPHTRSTLLLETRLMLMFEEMVRLQGMVSSTTTSQQA